MQRIFYLVISVNSVFSVVNSTFYDAIMFKGVYKYNISIF